MGLWVGVVEMEMEMEMCGDAWVERVKRVVIGAGGKGRRGV